MTDLPQEELEPEQKEEIEVEETQPATIKKRHSSSDLSEFFPISIRGSCKNRVFTGLGDECVLNEWQLSLFTRGD